LNIGKLGVWFMTDGMKAAEVADLSRRIETWGYGALWLPEPSFGRNVLVHASWLLANTTTLTIATGIANIYARDPVAMNAAWIALNEQSSGRFLLGMGVSHAPSVEKTRGHTYGKPVATMSAYIDAMQMAECLAPAPADKPKMILAALGPQMLALARDRADGAHPYLTTPVHTARARDILGPDKWLCPEQKVLLETDPAEARRKARLAVGRSPQLANYRNNLVSLGFNEADFAGNLSDRLIDSIVAWGDETTIRRRIQEHWDAGADHVCIQPVSDGRAPYPRADDRLLELLAPAQP
jgi:probable F420-dependent oxidoreductase